MRASRTTAVGKKFLSTSEQESVRLVRCEAKERSSRARVGSTIRVINPNFVRRIRSHGVCRVRPEPPASKGLNASARDESGKRGLEDLPRRPLGGVL